MPPQPLGHGCTDTPITAPAPQLQGRAASSSADHPDSNEFPVTHTEPDALNLQSDISGTRQLLGDPRSVDRDLTLGESQMSENVHPFDEFATFLDLIGLPAEWAPAGIDIPSAIPEDGGARLPSYGEADPAAEEAAPDDSPFQAWLPSVPTNEECLHAFNELRMSFTDIY